MVEPHEWPMFNRWELEKAFGKAAVDKLVRAKQKTAARFLIVRWSDGSSAYGRQGHPAAVGPCRGKTTKEASDTQNSTDQGSPVNGSTPARRRHAPRGPYRFDTV